MSSRKRNVPTMADVARATGLSPTTISFVINNTPTTNIPSETRERVWQVIRELGYRPNAAARMLRTQRSHTIGVITDEVATSPYAGEIIRGAQEAAWNQDRLLLIVSTGDNESVRTAAIETFLERQVEGIVYAAWFHRQVDPPKAIFEVAAVLVDCFTTNGKLPSVVPDEFSGGRSATEILLAHGHRRIGLINMPANVPAAAIRQAGYRAALEAAGVPYEDDLVCEASGNAHGGYDATMALMRDTSTPPTALFCANDRMAMGAYDALRTLSLRIPEDVSVVGFDNQELIAAFLRPALTTIALPHEAMGRWGVQHLLSLIDQPASRDGHSRPVQRLEPCVPVLRESVGPPAR